MPLSTRKSRYLVAASILLLIAPIVISGIIAPANSYSEAGGNVNVDSAQNLTFVSTMGGLQESPTASNAQIVAFHTPTKQVVWRHTERARYYDIDLLNNETILFSAAAYDSGKVDTRFAGIVMTWRTGEVHARIPLRQGVHDIDYIGDSEYAVADTLGDRIYVYNNSQKRIVWEYNFTNHLPTEDCTAGYGLGDSCTHVNDIDSVDNGSAFLTSPRNYDTVMLIDRETKETVWELGEQNNYEILNGQHNPDLLNNDTVLVSDSHNDRVAEYRHRGRWELSWTYYGELNWPRDADRLPNGNTLIVDTYGQRVVEVTPQRNVVWEVPVTQNPYDVERMPHETKKDVSTPPMSEFDTGPAVPPLQESSNQLLVGLRNTFDYVYFNIAPWLFPWWFGRGHFFLLIAAGLVAVGWITVESAIRFPFETVSGMTEPFLPYRQRITGIAVAGCILMATVILTIGVDFSRSDNALYIGLGLLIGLAAVRQLSEWDWNKWPYSTGIRRTIQFTRYVLAAGAIPLGLYLVYLAVGANNSPGIFLGLAVLLALFSISE